MDMPGRQYSTGSSPYRYGFNGKENDKDVSKGGQDYGARIYDRRLGRFLTVDPLTAGYPMLTPYQFASNRPIDGIDLDGKEFFKKDNYNYRMDYYPVASAGSVMQGVNNTANNIGAFLWNGTLGALLEGSKGVNNYFAGGYKEPSTDIMRSFDNWQTNAYKYHTTTPLKQQLKDLGATATDLRTYEILPSLIIAHKLFIPEVGIASSREIIGARVNLATDFYETSGFSPAKALQHMEGINFENAVQTTTLKKGTVIQQWVGKNGVGSYFTPLENGAAKNLGLNPSEYGQRTLQQFTITEDTKVLKSTAAPLNGGEGGGTQYFSPELQTNTKPKTTH